MMILLSDGWRDESSEGPYTETLQTKDDWEIVRLYGDQKFRLVKRGVLVQVFDTLNEAKAHVRLYEGADK